MKTVGIGTRVLNFLVDTLVVFLISYFLYKGLKYYATKYREPLVNFGYLFFTVLFFYYFICELLFARTLGKLVSFTKVVNKQGKRPNLLQVLIRSAARLTIIDCFFFPLWEKTLHDYLSKTEVVEK
jgi:uncharacterized RDD family membrane protein YckC